MSESSLVCGPGPAAGMVRTPDEKIVPVPAGWALCPPGDPALTHRLKAAGPTWQVQEKKGRKTFSHGIWASRETIEGITADLLAERAAPAYAKKLAAAARKREADQAEYVEDFGAAVVTYLRFSPPHAELAAKLAAAVTIHATPVGSGTVARTERIPIDERAEAAVIAWMRHQTTAYDSMTIRRVKGQRRQVRRQLAARSKSVLDAYRGLQTPPLNCPLATALRKQPESPPGEVQ